MITQKISEVTLGEQLQQGLVFGWLWGTARWAHQLFIPRMWLTWSGHLVSGRFLLDPGKLVLLTQLVAAVLVDVRPVDGGCLL